MKIMHILSTLLLSTTLLFADSGITDKYSINEILLVEDAINKNGLAKHPDLQLMLYAIGVAEGRRTDKYQFGIKHSRCSKTDFRQQAGWCAATILNTWKTWEASKKLQDTVPFTVYLARKYCPVLRDRKGHYNWIKNVTFWTQKFKDAREAALAEG